MVSGQIDSIFVDEGMGVKKNQLLAIINSDKILAQEQQQVAQLSELKESIKSLQAQDKTIEIQLDHASRNLKKTEQMLQNGAATEQSRDDLQTEVDVFKAQQAVIKQNILALEKKLEQIKSALKITRLTLDDSRIYSPTDGLILNRFRFENEFVTPGNPLFEVADLTKMEANIYLPLEDLANVKLGREVTVKVDGLEDSFSGRVRWISSESEFTPKTILTKETRTTLVYRVKVSIPNPEGVLKIGMPVDIVI
jgi:HlyD family secretion protein